METISYRANSGVAAVADCVVVGAYKGISTKDPENPRDYYQLQLAPTAEASPTYLFTEQELAEKVAATLQERGGPFSARATINHPPRGAPRVTALEVTK